MIVQEKGVETLMDVMGAVGGNKSRDTNTVHAKKIRNTTNTTI
jgi:hypothetical protein